MSGLVSVIPLPGAPPVSEAEIEALAADYEALRGPGRRAVWCGDEHGRAITYAGPVATPGPSREAPGWMAIAGALHPARPWTGSHRAELDEADGQFALVGHDGESRETVVATDPFGMYALFVTEAAGRLYVSTSAIALARHRRPSASREGILAFLLLGYQFGPKTHWTGIRRLEPGTCIVVSKTAVREETYWRPTIDPRIARMRMAEVVDEALDAATATMRSQFGGHEPWVDLTGGMDSRLLCLLLEAGGVRFKTNTRETRMPGDLDLARQVAQAAGWTWRYPRLPETWPAMIPERLRESLAWGDGQLEVLQLSRVLWAHEMLAAEGPHTLLSGGGGEHFQFWAWQSELLNAGRSNRPNLERWVNLQLLKTVDASMLAGNARDDVRADLLTVLRPRLEPYRSERNTTQLDALFAYRSTGHFGAYRSADGAHLEARLPFYLKPVFSVAFSADYRLRNGHELMKHMIHRLNPTIAAIPTTRGGPALPWRPWRAHRFLPYYAVLGRKGINKVSGRLLGRIVFPAQSDYEWQIDANRAVIGSLAGDGILDRAQMRIAPLLEPAAFDRFVEAADDPGFHGTMMLGRLLTAELALRATDTTLG